MKIQLALVLLQSESGNMFILMKTYIFLYGSFVWGGSRPFLGTVRPEPEPCQSEEKYNLVVSKYSEVTEQQMGTGTRTAPPIHPTSEPKNRKSTERQQQMAFSWTQIVEVSCRIHFLHAECRHESNATAGPAPPKLVCAKLGFCLGRFFFFFRKFWKYFFVPFPLRGGEKQYSILSLTSPCMPNHFSSPPEVGESQKDYFQSFSKKMGTCVQRPLALTTLSQKNGRCPYKAT